ncbi:MAG: response regulator [Desulfurivibrionaceae bacterium]|jgi:CheY-like chemotaxis protein
MPHPRTDRCPHAFLIIDDGTVARTTLKNHLIAMFTDCKISEAVNGAQGLFLFFKKKPDLVFLDMLMPIMDGRADRTGRAERVLPLRSAR